MTWRVGSLCTGTGALDHAVMAVLGGELAWYSEYEPHTPKNPTPGQAGWVTEVPRLSRNQQLKLLGNGVVPQQAAAALRLLLTNQVALFEEQTA